MQQFDYNKYRKNNPLLKEAYTPDERIYVGKASKTGPLAVASDYLYSMEKALKQLDRVIDKNPNISAKEVITMVLSTLQKVKDAQKKGDPSFQGDFSMNEDEQMKEAKGDETWFSDVNYFKKQHAGYKLKPTDKVSIGDSKVMTYADALKKYAGNAIKKEGANQDGIETQLMSTIKGQNDDMSFLDGISDEEFVAALKKLGLKYRTFDDDGEMNYYIGKPGNGITFLNGGGTWYAGDWQKP